MFKIICENCGSESYITYTEHSYGGISENIIGDIWVLALDGQLDIKCENCGSKLDFYNDEIIKGE
jgi:DNA-directed RNA polymerase subunit RPC12/RpoP